MATEQPGRYRQSRMKRSAAMSLKDANVGPVSPKDVIMRYTPLALALSALVALSASSGQSQVVVPMNPRAASLEAIGRGALAAGDVGQATDAFEAALAVDPGAGRLLVDLAAAARGQGMPGKALHYYRAAMDRDPQDTAAIAGEGEALAEQGALDKARRDLSRLENLCGADCPASRELATAIDKQAEPKMVSAEALKPQDAVTPN